MRQLRHGTVRNPWPFFVKYSRALVIVPRAKANTQAGNSMENPVQVVRTRPG
jgi:hypothetical protein